MIRTPVRPVISCQRPSSLPPAGNSFARSCGDIELHLFSYFGLSQWGRFRLEANASLKRELFSDFYFGLKGYESYDSEPPTAGAQKNDWGLSLSLGYSF